MQVWGQGAWGISVPSQFWCGPNMTVRVEGRAMGTKFQFGKIKKFWRLLVMMVSQPCKCT